MLSAAHHPHVNPCRRKPAGVCVCVLQRKRKDIEMNETVREFEPLLGHAALWLWSELPHTRHRTLARMFKDRFSLMSEYRARAPFQL
jgi:hypothetical protein